AAPDTRNAGTKGVGCRVRSGGKELWCSASSPGDVGELRKVSMAAGEVAGEEPLIQPRGHLWTFALSPDGSKIVAGSENRKLWLWDTRTHAPLRSFAGHE